MKLFLTGLLFPLALVLNSAAQAQDGDQNIVEVAQAAGSFNTLIAAAQAAGLAEALSDPDSTLTVFAPTDDAFALLGEETIDALLADPETLADILLYHVIADAAVDAATALSVTPGTVDMANGDFTALSLRDGALFINNSQVVATDIQASNGIIHVIDAVLIPPTEPAAATGNIVETAIAAGSFNTLIAAAQAAGLDSVLADEASTFTVFAPTDDAFAKLGDDTIAALLGDTDTLSNILLYHVISGATVDSITALSLVGSTATMANGDEVAIYVKDGSLYLNDSQVLVSDVQATNGVIHVIDTVLIPPTMDTERQVQSIYLAFYGRPADASGLAWWSSRLAAMNNNLADILVEFSTSAEFTDRYGSLDNEALLNSLYQQLFGRDIDPEGMTFYTEQLVSGQLTIQSIALDVLNGAKNDDLAIINNKIAAAEYFTQQLAASGYSYAGNDAAEAAAALLAGIDGSASDVEAAVDAFFAAQ